MIFDKTTFWYTAVGASLLLQLLCLCKCHQNIIPVLQQPYQSFGDIMQSRIQSAPAGEHCLNYRNEDLIYPSNACRQ